MTLLEEKKLKAELLRIQSAKAEMEYILVQKQEEIVRIEENIRNQEVAESKMLDKLQGK